MDDDIKLPEPVAYMGTFQTAGCKPGVLTHHAHTNLETLKVSGPQGQSVQPLFTADQLRAIEQAATAPLLARIAELEKLCDETYVKQGADAYNNACDEMERWQKQRKADSKEVGTTGSLCDGIAWLYLYVSKLEQQLEEVGKDATIGEKMPVKWTTIMQSRAGTDTVKPSKPSATTWESRMTDPMKPKGEE